MHLYRAERAGGGVQQEQQQLKALRQEYTPIPSGGFQVTGFISRMQEAKSCGIYFSCAGDSRWISQREEHPAQFARGRTAAILCAAHHGGIGKPRDVLLY